MAIPLNAENIALRSNTAQESRSVVLPYPPSANKYWRMVAGRMLVSREARQYKTAAGWLAVQAGIRPTSAMVALTVNVYRPRRAGDLDNSLKITIDSLRGIAFADDSQVVEIHAYRHDDKANPRVEVEVEAR